MEQVTHTQLQSLIDNSNLVVGEMYAVTDYPNYNLSMTAVSENELSDEAYNYTSGDNLVFHYVPSTNTVDYMKDTYRLIEGNFDWTDNVTGNCRDIHFGDCVGLTLENCIGVFCNGITTGRITDSQNIILGDSNEVEIDNCNYLTIGNGNTMAMGNSNSVSIGNGNTLALSDLDSVLIYDNNEELQIKGVNIIGSNNRNIRINGDSNVVKCDNIDVEITGYCNYTDRTKYVMEYGSYNTIDKTTLSTLDTAFANEVRNSHSVNINNTNNNIVRTDAIEVKDKPAFVEYATTGAVTRVENLAGRVNMQADSTATTLIADEEKMWQSNDTKADKHYIIVDGQWKSIE